MILPTGSALLLIALIAALTLFTRAAPFLLFPEGRRSPAFIMYLGQVLPPALLAMLVVYCLKAVTPLEWPFGLPELIAVAAVVLLHRWKRNTMLSIGAGTVLYMILVQLVFI